MAPRFHFPTQTMAMVRFATILLIGLFSAGCANFVENLQSSVENRVQQMLAGKFSELLTQGIDTVINGLAAEGGFLDDPLVRILLPPPLGLAIGVARDLQRDPQAALLETLINRAAEDAIPVAGPILKDMIVNMDTEKLQSLLDAPEAAATDYLMEQGGAVVKDALLPVVTERLHANGAIQLYGELVAARQAVDQATQPVVGSELESDLRKSVDQAVPDIETPSPTPPLVVAPVAPEQLAGYVAEQAMGGLFKKVATQELQIRDSLDSMVEIPI